MTILRSCELEYLLWLLNVYLTNYISNFINLLSTTNIHGLQRLYVQHILFLRLSQKLHRYFAFLAKGARFFQALHSGTLDLLWEAPSFEGLSPIRLVSISTTLYFISLFPFCPCLPVYSQRKFSWHSVYSCNPKPMNHPAPSLSCSAKWFASVREMGQVVMIKALNI